MKVSDFKNKIIKKNIKIETVSGKNKIVKIYNYTNDDYNFIKELIESKYKLDNEDEEITFSDDELTCIFGRFTNVKMSVDELNEIMINPNHYFKLIFNEIQIIINCITEKMLSDKLLEISNVRKEILETEYIMESCEFEKHIQSLGKYAELFDGLGDKNG